MQIAYSCKLHIVEVNDLFDTLPDKGEDTDFKKAFEALTRYFTPRKNASFEIFKFRSLKQEPNETIDEFHTRLQMASKYCEFGENKKKEIKAQIELGTINKKLRCYSFRTPALTLTELLDYARTLHETEKQASGIEANTKQPSSNFEDDAIKFNLDNQDTQSYLTDNAHLLTLQNNVFVVDIHGLTLWEVNALQKANSVATVPNTIILLVYADHEERKTWTILLMQYNKHYKTLQFHPRMKVHMDSKVQIVMTVMITLFIHCTRNKISRIDHHLLTLN